MNSTGIILLILLAAYVPIWYWARRSAKAKEKGLETWGPALKINTKLGIKVIDRLARYRRFWHAMGVVSQIVALLLMVIMMVIMVNAVINLPRAFQASGIGIEYALALPGLNPLMPFWFTLLGFIIALVFHEMAHGIQSRANDIGVNYTGLLYMVVPLGAFVEPDEEQVSKASRRANLDLFAAGITANFFIAVVSFLLFSTIMLGGLHSPYDDNAGVYSSTDAEGIPVGAMITSVEWYDSRYDFIYEEITDYRDALDRWPLGTMVSVIYDTESEKGLVKDTVWGVRVAGVVSDSPASGIGMAKDDTVISFTDSGGTHYLYSAAAFTSYMKTTSPGETVSVSYYHKATATVETSDVTLSEKSGIGFLGISTTTAGMVLVTADDIRGMAMSPFYHRTGVSDHITGMLAYIANPFNGFTPIPEPLQWWYDEPFQGFWTIACILYWTFWLNILLGITNALPAVPFDGGYIFQGWVDGLMERLGKKDKEAREKQVEEITKNVSTLMLILLFLVVIAAVL